jgi:hypothetical protein
VIPLTQLASRPRPNCVTTQSVLGSSALGNWASIDCTSVNFRIARYLLESPSKLRDAFTRQYEFGSALEESLWLMSCTGGFPNSRLKSRSVISRQTKFNPGKSFLGVPHGPR